MGSYAFSFEDDFTSYVSELKESLEGNVNDDVDVSFGNPILTLSTCIDEYPEKRWLVNAVLVEEQWY